MFWVLEVFGSVAVVVWLIIVLILLSSRLDCVPHFFLHIDTSGFIFQKSICLICLLAILRLLISFTTKLIFNARFGGSDEY